MASLSRQPENALRNTAWLISILMPVPEKLNVWFSSSFRLKTTFILIYIKQFVEACHGCDYTSVEAGSLKTHLMLVWPRFRRSSTLSNSPDSFIRNVSSISGPVQSYSCSIHAVAKSSTCTSMTHYLIWLGGVSPWRSLFSNDLQNLGQTCCVRSQVASFNNCIVTAVTCRYKLPER